MKIEIKKVPDSGTLDLEQTFGLDELDLNADAISVSEPVNARVQVSKGINTVTVQAFISGAMQFICSRCLKSFKWPFQKKVRFNHELKPNVLYIEIDKDLREEIILDFPVKPLCKPDCRGLCPHCGEDLNMGECKCK